MADGAVSLSETNSPVLDVFCSRCGRRGRYRIETLVDRFGADARLPDVASTEATLQRLPPTPPCARSMVGTLRA